MSIGASVPSGSTGGLCSIHSVIMCVIIYIYIYREREGYIYIYRERERYRSLYTYVCMYVCIHIYIYTHIYSHSFIHSPIHQCLMGVFSDTSFFCKLLMTNLIISIRTKKNIEGLKSQSHRLCPLKMPAL